MVGIYLMFRYLIYLFFCVEWLLYCGSCDNGAIFQVFDLRSLAWSALKMKMESDADKVEENNLQEVFPATSGHDMVKIPFLTSLTSTSVYV